MHVSTMLWLLVVISCKTVLCSDPRQQRATAPSSDMKNEQAMPSRLTQADTKCKAAQGSAGMPLVPTMKVSGVAPHLLRHMGPSRSLKKGSRASGEPSASMKVRVETHAWYRTCRVRWDCVLASVLARMARYAFRAQCSLSAPPSTARNEIPGP